MEPQLINKFAIAAFCAFKDFGTDSEGDCNLELIRAFLTAGYNCLQASIALCSS